MSALSNLEPSEIRRMEKKDLASVLEIERACYSFPWSESVFNDCLSANYDCLIIGKKMDVAGYCIVATAVGESHILNVCIGPAYQKQGCGTELVRYVLERAIQNRIETIFLEVRVSNMRAIRLYSKLGFRKVGVRRNYYPAGSCREDALVYSINLTNQFFNEGNLNLYI